MTDFDEGIEVEEVVEEYWTFRVDYPDNPDQVQRCKDFFLKYQDEFKRVWMFTEIADKTGKPHFQGVVCYGHNLSKEEEARIKMRIRTFFKVKGSQYSFARVQDLEKYLIYIVKQGKLIVQIGYTAEEYEHYRKLNEESRVAFEVKCEKDRIRRQNKSKTPMEKLWEFYEPYFLSKYESYKKTRVDNPTPMEFIEKHDISMHVARHVMMWYGEVAHKPFMIKNMSEAASYLKYRVFSKYSEHHREEMMCAGARNIVEHMHF